MAIRPILRMGHPLLREQAQAVDPAALSTHEFDTLLTDLRDTLAHSGGIGLAAPQIGVSLRVALIDLPGGPSRYGELPRIPATYFVNPTMRVLDPESAGYWEGCLSVPGLRGFVERPQALEVTAIDETGAARKERYVGFAATVIQHEFDHLDGTLYVDRIKDMRLLMFESEYERQLLEEQPAQSSTPGIAPEG